MTAAQITSLATAIVAIVTAVGTLLAQIGHLSWHKGAAQQPVAQVPPAPPEAPKP